MRFITLLSAVVGITILATTVIAQTPSITTEEPPKPRLPLSKPITGNLVFWDQERGFKTIQEHPEYFSEINPFWYSFNRKGQIVPYKRADGNTYEDPKIISFLRRNNIKIVPTIANTESNDEWPTAALERILASEQLMDAHAKELTNLVVSKQYDGLNLDYENLPASSRHQFTRFVEKLARELHAQGKTLNIAVYAKTSEPGMWAGPQGQDWAALSKHADQIVIMLYNWHWSTSEAGVIAPLDWTRSVLAFANQTIPQHKITYSMHLFGYDWVGKRGTDTVWADFTKLARQKKSPLRWDNSNHEVLFTYTANNTPHTVWFVNATSTRTRVKLAKNYNVGTINFWRLGGEDPAMWPALKEELLPRRTN